MSGMSRTVPLLAVLAAAVVTLPSARAGDAPKPREPELRLVHLLDGLRPDAPDDDPARVGETKTAQAALKFGIDLTKPPHPLFAHASRGGRVWYLFYKVTENAFGDRPYVIQRIRKIERTWKDASDTKPEEKSTYQVEVFKTLGGTLKQADQHFGDYGLHDAHRREIVKEYEIGLGEVPGSCEGTAWPFPATSLYQLLQAYVAERGIYDDVVFKAARKWSLTVSFSADGSYAIRSPELGIDAPKSVPDPEKAAPRPDAESKDVVLTPGRGFEKARCGEGTAEELKSLLGEPLESAAVGKASTNLSFRRSVTCNLDATGKLNTVITRAGFAGRTSNGISHGLTRSDVMKKLGAPSGQRADAVNWRYAGLQISFDGFDRVSRLVVFR